MKDLVLIGSANNQKRLNLNRFSIIFFCLLVLGICNIKAQSFQWAKDIKSEGFDEGYDLAVDSDGNTYVAGQMEYDTDFGNNVILSSAGVHDIFLAKYNPAGKLVWAKRAGGKGGDKIQSIVLDGAGHIYVAGEFEDTCYWEGIMKVTPGLGINNMFVAKYDTTGHVIWVRNISGTGALHTRGYGVTCDAQGNVYACGGTKGDTYYNNTFLFTSAGDYDGTVVKFDPNGNFCWARRMGGTDSDKAYGIASDNNGSIYVTGYFVGSADFSSSVSLTGRGHTDIFIAKYDTAGLLQWAKQAGDTGFDRGWDVSVNVNGQILITGEFQTGHFGSNMAHSRGNEDMFLASYDSNGNNLWVLSGGSVEDDIGRGVTHDASGNIYVIGDYASTGIFPGDTVVSNGFADVFLACYKPDGSDIKWIHSAGGPDSDRGRGVGVDLGGNISICGEYVNSILFGNTQLNGDSLLDIFVTRLVPGNLCTMQVTASAQNSCSGLCNGIAFASATGQSPIIYNWSTNPPQSGAALSGLCQGNYTVTAIDAAGCTSSAQVTVANTTPIQPSATFTNASCKGLCNGIATASATGNGPFTFNWLTSPPQNDSIATSLCQGTYTVVATDADGCTSTASITLTDPPLLQPSVVFTNPGCPNACDGLATASANGNGPFTFNWLTNPPQNTSTVTGLCQGNYTVVTTDVMGCTATTVAALVDPQPLQLSYSITNASCIGCSNGNIDILVTGGTNSYQYQWSNGSTTEDIQNLRAGIYSVCVTDLNNCNLCNSFTILDPSTGIIESTVAQAYSVYPNPFNSFTTIHIKATTAEVTIINVYNITGQVVYHSEFSGEEFNLPANDLLSGVYFLRLENKFNTKSFIIPLCVER